MSNLRLPWCLVAAMLLCGCPSAPGGQVAGDSRTPECSAELRGALKAFGRDLGFDYEVSPNDGDTLMSTGTISKSYARDGGSVRIDFGLEPTESSCSLVAYKMVQSRPGRTTTTGKRGSVDLQQCACVADPS